MGWARHGPAQEGVVGGGCKCAPLPPENERQVQGAVFYDFSF